MNTEINWDDFPEPYRHELREDVELAYQRLCPEGVEVLDDIFEGARQLATLTDDEEPNPEFTAALGDRMLALPKGDQRLLGALLPHLVEAHTAAVEQARGQVALAEDLGRVIDRARELDPSFPPNGAVGQARAVLEAHGVQLGVSEEVMEMAFEVPSPRPDEDED